MNTEIVIPSTKLKCVNVHKLSDTSCNRYYFWRWVLNLVPKGFNINFWFGTVVHTGIEQVAMKTSPKKTAKIMYKEDVRICHETPPEVGIIEEVRAQRRIAQIMVKVYRKIVQEKMDGLHVGGTEVFFQKQLKQSRVKFQGRLDAWYMNKAGIVLFEGKTASQPSNDYFRRLTFDKQINGYAIGLKDIVGKYPRECCYTVFRKPQIRQRKKETPDDFFSRLEQDLIERRDWYFIFYRHLFGRGAIRAVLNDIEWMTFDLAAKYDYLTKDQLLDPANWPRNDSQCFKYGTCPYFSLCRRPKSYPLYFRFYRMRDIRYDIEKEELDNKREFSTRTISSIKGAVR